MIRRLKLAGLLVSVLTLASCEECCVCDPCLFGPTTFSSNANSNSNTSSSCDDTIGSANGTSCTVISKTETSRADSARCGFNDLSLPNIAIYEVERRQCTKYKDGKIENSYQDSNERFVRCHNP